MAQLFSSIYTNGTSASPKVAGDQMRGRFKLGSMIHLVGASGSAPACRAVDSGSNSGPDKNFTLKVNSAGPADC